MPTEGEHRLAADIVRLERENATLHARLEDCEDALIEAAGTLRAVISCNSQRTLERVEEVRRALATA